MAKQLRRVDPLRIAIWVFTVAIYVFLAAPMLVVVLSSFSPTQYLTFPPPGVSLRWYAEVFQTGAWLSAMALSGFLIIIVAPLSLALGTPAAYALVRFRFPGRGPITAFLLSPLMVPQVMLGIALLYYFVSIHIINTVPGLIVAHTIVALPYVVRVVMVNMYSLDATLDRAASILGANRWRVWRDVTLPQLRPGVVAGGVFAAITSLGELALTIFVAGPATTTVPLKLFSDIQFSFDPVITAVSAIFVFVAIPTLFILDRLVGLTKLF